MPFLDKLRKITALSDRLIDEFFVEAGYPDF
jgi:hypothetical protein